MKGVWTNLDESSLDLPLVFVLCLTCGLNPACGIYIYTLCLCRFFSADMVSSLLFFYLRSAYCTLCLLCTPVFSLYPLFTLYPSVCLCTSVLACVPRAVFVYPYAPIRHTCFLVVCTPCLFVYPLIYPCFQLFIPIFSLLSACYPCFQLVYPLYL